MSEIKDEFLREKWKITEANIKSEIAHTIQILEICKNLKNFDYDKKQMEDSNANIKKNKNLLVIPFDSKEKIPQQKKLPNVNYFGGKLPFNQTKENEDPFDDFKKGEINALGKDLNDVNVNNRNNPTNRYCKENDESIQSSNILNSFCKNAKDDNSFMLTNNVNSSNNQINIDKKYDNALNKNLGFNNNNINNEENYVVYKKPVNNSNNNVNNINSEKKDPMVWDPPEEKVVNNRKSDNKIGRNAPPKKSGVSQAISKRANGNK